MWTKILQTKRVLTNGLAVRFEWDQTYRHLQLFRPRKRAVVLAAPRVRRAVVVGPVRRVVELAQRRIKDQNSPA